MVGAEGAGPDEGPDQLEVSAEARADRLARRVAALERQLEARIEQVEHLRRQLAHGEAHSAFDDRRSNATSFSELERKAAEYDALMRTFTMRALSRPRGWYAALRRRVSRR